MVYLPTWRVDFYDKLVEKNGLDKALLGDDAVQTCVTSVSKATMAHSTTLLLDVLESLKRRPRRL